MHQVVEAQQELESQKAPLILTHLQKIKHFNVKPCKKGQEMQVCSSALALTITALGHPAEAEGLDHSSLPISVILLENTDCWSVEKLREQKGNK